MPTIKSHGPDKKPNGTRMYVPTKDGLSLFAMKGITSPRSGEHLHLKHPGGTPLELQARSNGPNGGVKFALVGNTFSFVTWEVSENGKDISLLPIEVRGWTRTEPAREGPIESKIRTLPDQIKEDLAGHKESDFTPRVAVRRSPIARKSPEPIEFLQVAEPCRKIARNLGCSALPWDNKGYPDDLIFYQDKLVMAAEYKRLGEDLEILQKQRIQELRDMGLKAEGFDNPAEFEKVLKEQLAVLVCFVV